MIQVPVDSTAAIAQASTVITSSALISYFIEWLKKSTWFPFITKHTSTVNHLAAAALTFFASIGIHWEFNKENHALTITGLCAVCLMHSSWDWAKSYVATKLIYQGVISKAPVTEVAIVPKPKEGEEPKGTNSGGK